MNRNIIDQKTKQWWEGPNYEGPSDKTVGVVKFETLTGDPIAVYYNYAMHGVTVGQLAWMNGLDPNAPLLAGTALKLPTQAPVAAPAQPQPAPVTLPDAEPNATSARLTSAQIGQVATQHGVSPSLAAAVA